MKRLAAFLVLCAGVQLVQCRDLDLKPQGEHWLRFVQITDVHCLDEESPGRIVRLDNLHDSAWHPQDAYTTQVLAATLDVISHHHAVDEWPIDFLLATGDLTDNAQKNELDWFLAAMDGREIVPDSGALEGPLSTDDPGDNPNLPFLPRGLPRDIPWYALVGNHDCLASGVFAINRDAPEPESWYAPQLGLVARFIGLDAAEPPRSSLVPTGDWSPAVILANEELADPAALRLDASGLTPGPVPEDKERRYLSKKDFVEAFFHTETRPLGHGFTPDGRLTGKAWYSVRPIANLPIRLVALDTAAESPVPLIPQHYGILPRSQFDGFVRPEIEKAAKAGEFVIVVSHHPSSDFDLPHPVDAVSTSEFRNYLARQNNVIAHLCGHTHRNRVTRIGGKHPYPEIETCSLIDDPQEARMIDIFYDPSTGNVTLTASMIGHMEAPTRLAQESYRRAMADRDATGLPVDLRQANLQAVFEQAVEEEAPERAEFLTAPYPRTIGLFETDAYSESGRTPFIVLQPGFRPLAAPVAPSPSGTGFGPPFTGGWAASSASGLGKPF